MAGKDVLTTRIGDVVKVEVKDPRNEHGTLPNYGHVGPMARKPGFGWQVASGQSGEAPTEKAGVNAVARTIRKHAARHSETQKAIASVPVSVVEAVGKLVEHYGEKSTKVFHSADGEAVVHYRTDDRSGVGMIHIVPTRNGDSWVCVLHTMPGNVEPGLPDVFVSTPMYDTTKDWWASKS